MVTPVIVWLNGPFGVGKTTVARALRTRLSAARILDPERIGWVLARWTPAGRRANDFQDLTSWRRATVRVAGCAARHGTVIVPMTVVDPAVHAEVIERLAGRHDLRLVTLTAKPSTIRARLHGRGRDTAWGEQHLERCVAALADAPALVATDDRDPGAVAEAVAALLPMAVSLTRENASARA